MQHHEKFDMRNAEPHFPLANMFTLHILLLHAIFKKAYAVSKFRHDNIRKL